ncbi:hypothetical protein [Sphingomonas sp. SORGH_AS_0879]|uniref:hypothetical protein n=1 Tax=Sphingomonas sp. SORGH_AS_0879 TaxID=3041790 RepID=UPI002785A38E|nr:hypothetical protein [Sphingomonas sp. SORGH_AS_0879]MDQ1231399.1 hypothetical protein [Sphingomonas sp. SORGH_AS_0879]
MNMMTTEGFTSLNPYDGLVTPSFDEFEKGIYLNLRLEPFTNEAKFLIEEILSNSTQVSGPKRPFEAAVGALVGDMLRVRASGPERYGFRTVKKQSFTGEFVGYRPFIRAAEHLKNMNLIGWNKGQNATYVSAGIASRFWSMDSLLSLAKSFGITPENYKQHFRRRSGMRGTANYVTLKSASRKTRETYGAKIAGRDMGLPVGNNHVFRYQQEMRAINEALFRHDYSFEFSGLRRLFNNGDTTGETLNEGGRMYAIGGGYQQMPKAKRSKILINGLPTVEIDLSGSHYTIATLLLDQPYNRDIDPYSVPGYPREIVKSFVNASMGNGKPIHHWPNHIKESYGENEDGLLDVNEADKESPRKENELRTATIEAGKIYTGNLEADWPIKNMKADVLPHFPILKMIEDNGIFWGKLQFEESCVIVEAVHRLSVEMGIPTLPIHDSLIVPNQDQEAGRQVFEQFFFERFGSIPRIK